LKEKINISICLGSSCAGRNSNDILSAIKEHIKQKSLSDKINLKVDYCFGRCSEGPAIMINETIYTKITPQNSIILLEGYLGVEKH